MEYINITDISGIKIGNAENVEAATGCTVIICENGAVTGVDVRGGAPGTRETDLLDPINLIDKVHGVFLSGGSAFGLDAASGIMKYLEERAIGFDVGVTKVPIVTGAVLFDLNLGDHKTRPDKVMGYEACVNSEHNKFFEGSVGAGTGASVGKILGVNNAMKGGLGSCCIKAGDLIVGAVVAVNCLGDVVDPNDNRIIAGALIPGKDRFLDTENFIISNPIIDENLFHSNTTIGAVITNAAFSKSQAKKIASIAHNGYARTIRPAHTMHDGDTIFALSVGDIKADLSAVGIMAVKTIEQAVLNGVKKSYSMYSLKGVLSV